MKRCWIVVLAAAFALGACGGKSKSQDNKKPVVRKPAAPPAPPSASIAPPKVTFAESDFGESEQSRDPFRTFTDIFKDESETKVQSQREVVLDEYAIDELKLIGIVSRIHPARAMLQDPRGKGHVVRRGQFVGKAEVVRAAGQGSANVEVNWRVDRVREADIVLVREDPSNPDAPVTTRVIPLHPEGSVLKVE